MPPADPGHRPISSRGGRQRLRRLGLLADDAEREDDDVRFAALPLEALRNTRPEEPNRPMTSLGFPLFFISSSD